MICPSSDIFCPSLIGISPSPLIPTVMRSSVWLARLMPFLQNASRVSLFWVKSHAPLPYLCHSFCARAHGSWWEVPFQPEQKFENFCIEFVIIATELLLHPAGKSRGFVVQEDAAVLYARFSFCHHSPYEADCISMFNRHIRPPVPWRYSYLL